MGKGGKHQSVAPGTSPVGDLARNPGTCPDRESHRRPFSGPAGPQPTGPHQPGWECSTSWSVCSLHEYAEFMKFTLLFSLHFHLLCKCTSTKCTSEHIRKSSPIPSDPDSQFPSWETDNPLPCSCPPKAFVHVNKFTKACFFLYTYGSILYTVFESPPAPPLYSIAQGPFQMVTCVIAPAHSPGPGKEIPF